MFMRKALAITLIIALAIIAMAAGAILVNLAEDKETLGKLYTYPVSVGEKNYTITVKTNWTSEPQVYLPKFGTNYVSVDFRGTEREQFFFNITIPTDLIGGEISVIAKYYKLSSDRYTLSNNGTHNSVYMTYDHIAFVEHFEIHGTEGAW